MRAVEYAAAVLLANRLREAREHADMSTRELAEALGRPQSYVVDIENLSRRVAVHECWAIAEATGYDLANLVLPPRDEDEVETWEEALEDFESGLAELPRRRKRGEGRGRRKPRERDR
ncbi:MAG TPA: helix-turn-helix transcriptional regulator [Gemmatimonadales bacterium]